MPRLVRRAPLATRIKAYLNPLDFLLWVSEELNSNELENIGKQWATPVGIGLNIIFMIARANSHATTREFGGDVFGDDVVGGGTGWLAWFASFNVHLLSLLSISNAVYTFWRGRHYRLFENPIDSAPRTSSAQRVHVDSSPVSSSPLRFLSSFLEGSSAESRTYADPSRDVWELKVWDPTPLCLQTFCLFSPGHILVYWLFLPLDALDPRPSVTVVKTLLLTALLSVQLSVFHRYFSQQLKDSTIIHQQVQKEHDIKFVRPTIYKPVRDTGTQTVPLGKSHQSFQEVLIYTPKTYVNRGFQTNPNPTYSQHYDPDGSDSANGCKRSYRAATSPTFETPSMNGSVGGPSPFAPSVRTSVHQPQFRSPSASLGGGEGGSLGVYTHAYSPLKKSTPLSSAAQPRLPSPKKREGSPLKQSSTPGGIERSNPSEPRNRFSQLRGDGVKRQVGRY